jgi:hypothetical protein
MNLKFFLFIAILFCNTAMLKAQLNCSPISSLPCSPLQENATITTLSGTGGVSDSPCLTGSGQDAIYSFTSGVAGQYVLSIGGSLLPNPTGLFSYSFKPVSDGCSSTGWTCIGAGVLPLNGNGVAFTLAASTEYYIWVKAASAGTHHWAIACPSCNSPYGGGYTNSSCSGCSVSGGSFTPNNCSNGTPEYSVNGGPWTTTLPTYNTSASMTVGIRCNCGDGNVAESNYPWITNPDICTPPAATASDNDPACGGILNLTSTPAGATSYSWTGPGGYTSSVQNPTISSVNETRDGVYTVVVTGTNGCVNTATTTVGTITCSAAPTLSLTDPCNCANGLDLDSNGSKEYAQEVITIQPGAAPYTVTAVSGLFSSTGVALTTTTATALITGPDGSGNYIITAYLPANNTSTYSLTVQDSASLTDTATGGPCAPCTVNCAASSNMQWGN